MFDRFKLLEQGLEYYFYSFFFQTEEHLSATAAYSDVGDLCVRSTLALIDQGLMCVCKYISLFYLLTCTY